MFICKASEFKIQFTDVFVCFYYEQFVDNLKQMLELKQYGRGSCILAYFDSA